MQNSGRIFNIYRDMLPLFPDDLHLARPLIGLLQQGGKKEAAAKLAMHMARRMQVGGRHREVQGFLAMAKQLDYPDPEEIRDMESMAQIMSMSGEGGEASQGASFSLVEQLSDQEVREFLLQGEQVDVRAGSVVVMQGEVSKTFFLILRGKMDVLLNTNDGEKVKLATLDAGDYFGEFACIYQTPRSATVRAGSDARLLKFSDTVIHDLIARSPIAGERLMRVVQQRMITSLTYEHPAFAELPAGDREWLAESATVREFQAGEDICQDASLPNQWLIVIHGSAQWIVRFKAAGEVAVGSMITGSSKYLKCEQTMVRAREHVLVCDAPVAIFSSFMKAYGGFERWVKAQQP
ncbi:MAG: cyclic nucleotide-binding domain-containing protein [Mariprofundales bacterium]